MEERNNPNTIQHVPKSCSDQLLMKFAQLGNEPKATTGLVGKRRKKEKHCVGVGCLPEKRSLLTPVTVRHRGTVVWWRVRVGKRDSKVPFIARDRSFVQALEKGWRMTIEGASKVLLMEKHYNRHKRLPLLRDE
ncbi:hypothetical protein M569_04803 [Genlisea aurea]|uniref:Uncharacterized protein n=1 Tax=Genlisea aurea TaxID=192259 RepID=S8CRV4_9LAMI|nr:hypothetical protein M569_04803 [Genlisea aurea]